MRLVPALAICAPLVTAGGNLVAPTIALATQCSVSAGNLDFGPIDTLGSAGTGAATDLTISCDQVPGGVDMLTVCGHLGAGSGGSSEGNRRMAPGTSAPLYGLYTDPGLTNPWGNGMLGAPLRLKLGAANGAASAVVTLYGLVFGLQSQVPPGQYGAELSGADATFYFDEGDLLDCSGNQSAVGTIMVAAEVLPNCLIAAGNLDFGIHGVIDGNIDAAADLAVTCTPGTAFSLALDGGTSGAGAPDARQMRSGTDSITYGLYMDAGRQASWGEGMQVQSGEGSGGQEIHTVYGRVPPQPAPVGNYTDIVVVTVTYQ